MKVSLALIISCLFVALFSTNTVVECRQLKQGGLLGGLLGGGQNPTGLLGGLLGGTGGTDLGTGADSGLLGALLGTNITQPLLGEISDLAQSIIGNLINTNFTNNATKLNLLTDLLNQILGFGTPANPPTVGQPGSNFSSLPCQVTYKYVEYCPGTPDLSYQFYCEEMQQPVCCGYYYQKCITCQQTLPGPLGQAQQQSPNQTGNNLNEINLLLALQSLLNNTDTTDQSPPMMRK